MCTYTHTHTSDRVQTVYELPLSPNNTALKQFCTDRDAVRSVDWIVIFFSSGHHVVLLSFNNMIVFEWEHNKQYLFTRNRATSFGTVVPSSDHTVRSLYFSILMPNFY